MHCRTRGAILHSWLCLGVCNRCWVRPLRCVYYSVFQQPELCRAPLFGWITSDAKRKVSTALTSKRKMTCRQAPSLAFYSNRHRTPDSCHCYLYAENPVFLFISIRREYKLLVSFQIFRPFHYTDYVFNPQKIKLSGIYDYYPLPKSGDTL